MPGRVTQGSMRSVPVTQSLVRSVPATQASVRAVPATQVPVRSVPSQPERRPTPSASAVGMLSRFKDHYINASRDRHVRRISEIPQDALDRAGIQRSGGTCRTGSGYSKVHENVAKVGLDATFSDPMHGLGSAIWRFLVSYLKWALI
jgi:hypothetical protein